MAFEAGDPNLRPLSVDDLTTGRRQAEAADMGVLLAFDDPMLTRYLMIDDLTTGRRVAVAADFA
jgi:hypothetical protein